MFLHYHRPVGVTTCGKWLSRAIGPSGVQEKRLISSGGLQWADEHGRYIYSALESQYSHAHLTSCYRSIVGDPRFGIHGPAQAE